MSKRKRKHGNVDPVAVQVDIEVKRKRGSSKVTGALLSAVTDRWIETGELTYAGFTVKAVHWQNPERDWEQDAYTPADIELARTTLRLSEWARGHLHARVLPG